MATQTDAQRKKELARQKGKLKAQIGDSGTYLVNGIIRREEYNKQLVGKTGIETYEEMRRGDSTVKASLKVVKEPIAGATWSVPSVSDDKTDIKAAKLIEHSLFDLQNWDSLLSEILTYLDFGHSIFEQCFGFVDFEGQRYLSLEKLAFRKQDTIVRWQTEDGEPGVTQILPGGTRPSIPWVKLAVFSHEQEGDNYEGVSVLRAAYRHWYIKDVLYKIDSISHEKHGLGVPKLTTPEGAKDGDREEAREIARQQRANEEAYIEIPDGFDFEFMDMKAGTLRDIMPSVLHHDRQILKNVLAQFLDIGGAGSSGSFAASKDQSPFFIMSLESIAKYVASVINGTVIKNIIDLNGLKVSAYPELKFAKIGQDDITKFSDAMQKLTSAGVVTMEAELEDHVRDVMNLPEMTDDLRKNYEEKRKKNEPSILDLLNPKKDDDKDGDGDAADKNDPDPELELDDDTQASELVGQADRLRTRLGHELANS